MKKLLIHSRVCQFLYVIGFPLFFSACSVQENPLEDFRNMEIESNKTGKVNPALVFPIKNENESLSCTQAQMEGVNPELDLEINAGLASVQDTAVSDPGMMRKEMGCAPAWAFDGNEISYQKVILEGLWRKGTASALVNEKILQAVILQEVLNSKGTQITYGVPRILVQNVLRHHVKARIVLRMAREDAGFGWYHEQDIKLAPGEQLAIHVPDWFDWNIKNCICGFQIIAAEVFDDLVSLNPEVR